MYLPASFRDVWAVASNCIYKVDKFFSKSTSFRITVLYCYYPVLTEAKCSELVMLHIIIQHLAWG